MTINADELEFHEWTKRTIRENVYNLQLKAQVEIQEVSTTDRKDEINIKLNVRTVSLKD